ncbi:MAG: hypothetical protein GY940_44835, partial [bacterium]|nr:hypothetical protein [bacterium]
ADVFLTTTTDKPCKDEHYNYSGTFKNKEIRGELKLSTDNSGCSGVLHANNGLGDYLGSFQGTEKDNFPVVYVGSEKNARYFVLISPMGLYSFSVDKEGIHFYGSSKTIDLKFVDGEK